MSETRAATAPQPTEEGRLDPGIRRRILSDPHMVLEDRELMAALAGANDAAKGDNVVDLRGVAMERLETRLSRLETTHNSVLTAAYENLAGTAQIQRAILRLLEAPSFDEFVETLGTDIAVILRVDAVRLVLETEGAAEAPASDVLSFDRPGAIDSYLVDGRLVPLRQVTLRPVPAHAAAVWRDESWIRSEACLQLDLGAGHLPALLALGSEDAGRFTAAHGADLLEFFGGVFERVLRRWVAPTEIGPR